MITWSELLRSQLDLPFLTPGTDPVPFGLPPIPGDAWEVHDLREQNGDWVLSAHTGGGVEATYTFRFFADTRAVECWGEIANRGSDPVIGVGQLLTLDTPFKLDGRFDRPWLRSINGVEPIPTYFPPYDFAPVDRHLVTRDMFLCEVTLSSAMNGRTSAKDLPVAILGDDAGTTGLAFMLEWSGTWSMSFRHHSIAEPSSTAAGARVQIGAWGFNLDLRPGQSLPLPRLLITAFDGDLDAGGNSIRRHLRRHVMPTIGGEEVVAPTSYNHWFAFMYDFSAASLRPAVEASAAAGLEYFVVDDGWFAVGQPPGLGNWNRVNTDKFPDGIEPFAEHVRSLGMKYGTWFEPEWAHIESDLYRDHPDWFWLSPQGNVWEPVLESPNHERVPNYAMVDFGRPEVQEWWIERIARAYHEWGVRWIRWDFNHPPRPNWEDAPVGEIGWRQIGHVQGLYRVWDEIMAACPELFIEQCASGGHRIDLGTVRRGHSFWMNDITENTDLVRAFQHGLNLVLPANYANTNLCQPRHDFTDYDYLSHAAGGFGYSGKLWEAPKADFDRFAAAIADFKGYRHVLQGDYSRPTGQPRREEDYARVEFSDGGEKVTMEFNHDGPRSARLSHEGGA